jgi:acetyltransferase-like isoleucine patch superfamily enzyme
MTFLITMFFRIIGAKIGKNVQINTWFLNDAYLLEIGDNVVIGGKTDVSCHSFEGGSLILNNVTIGCHTLIGQRCYISPGTTIGENSVIGQYVYVRKNTVVPPRTVLSSIAGLPLRTVARIERQTWSFPHLQIAFIKMWRKCRKKVYHGMIRYFAGPAVFNGQKAAMNPIL